MVLDAIESVSETILGMRDGGVSHRAHETVARRYGPVVGFEQVDPLHAEVAAHLAHLVEREFSPRPARGGQLEPRFRVSWLREGKPGIG